MPLIASYSQRDARGAAWLLANTAKKCFDNPADGPHWTDALNNAYQLLDSYRSNEFFGLETQPSRYARAMLGAEAADLHTERNIASVKAALDSSMRAVFEGQNSDSAIDEIEVALRFIAHPPAAEPSQLEKQTYDSAVQKAKQFFEYLSNALKDNGAPRYHDAI